MSDLSNNRPADKLVLCESYSEVDGIHECLYCYTSPIFEYRQCVVDTGSNTWDGFFSYEYDPTPFPMKIQDLYISRNYHYSDVRNEDTLKKVLEYGLFDAKELKSRLQGCYPDVQWPDHQPTRFHFCCLHWILGRFKSYIASRWQFKKVESDRLSTQIWHHLDLYHTLEPYLEAVYNIACSYGEKLWEEIVELLLLPSLDLYRSDSEFNQARSNLEQKIDKFGEQLRDIALEQGLFPLLHPQTGQPNSGDVNQAVENAKEPNAQTRSLAGGGSSEVVSDGGQAEGAASIGEVENAGGPKAQAQSPKRSAAKGRTRTRINRSGGSRELTDADEVMAAALRYHHGYESPKVPCTNMKCLSVRELAEKAGNLSTQTVHAFFEKWIKNKRYRQICKQEDKATLALEIAKLSREGLLQLQRNTEDDCKYLENLAFKKWKQSERNEEE